MRSFKNAHTRSNPAIKINKTGISTVDADKKYVTKNVNRTNTKNIKFIKSTKI